MKKTLLATALGVMACGAQAQNTTNALDPIFVTATRTAITVDDALSSVTVITRADIDRLQPRSIADLLTGLPGVVFAQSGGQGQQTSLFLRGTNSTHTLLLIDGIRVGSVSAGLPAFEQIPVSQIERIEIVRGPRSSLYGADAIGGVIQIFTRHGHPDGGLRPYLSLTGGSRSTLDGAVGLSGGDDHAWYNLSLGGNYTSGINACRPGAANVGAGCFANEPDDDAWRNWNGTASGGYRWDNGVLLTANWLRSKSDVEYDGSPYGGNQAVNEQRVAGARLSFDALAAWKVTLTAGQSKDLSSTYYQGVYQDIFAGTDIYYPRIAVGFANSRRNQVSWQNDVTLAPNQLLTAGLDYQGEHIDSATGYLDTRRSDTGGYAQYQGSFGANEVQLSARRDHNTQFGDHNTGAAAWGYHLGDGLLLSASYGSAFHAPTFNDLYYPYGSRNPDLKPETSRSAELGLSQHRDVWYWSLHAYQTRIDELITLDSNYVPMNISRARIRGLEGSLGLNLGAWRWQGYLTALQPVNDDGGVNNGNWLPRRPERTGRVDVDRSFGRWAVGATWNAAGKRYDNLANTVRLGGYTTTDLRASYALARGWQVQARLANAFNRNYETVYYFNQPGRSFFLTLRYAPE